MASSRGDEGGGQYYSPPARKPVKSHADKPAWKTVLQERCTARIREARRRLLSAARERSMNVRDVLNQIIVDEESGRSGWLGATDVPRGGSGGAAGGAGFGRAASACGAGSVAGSTELDEDLTEEERLELLLYLEDTLYRDMQDGGTCRPYRNHLRSASRQLSNAVICLHIHVVVWPVPANAARCRRRRAGTVCCTGGTGARRNRVHGGLWYVGGTSSRAGSQRREPR
jgi:hypothetical protein